MRKYLVITIDVEPDCTPNWTYSSPLTFDGVKTGLGKLLQPLFNRYDIIPSYLVNNVVLEDDKSIDVFKNLPGKFELGTHLHPEFMEPEKKFHDYAGKKGEANGCFYDPAIEFEKIKNITSLFQRQFGYAPIIFRAGRFSAGSNTIKSLVRLNYKVDTSVTPNVRWDDRTRERPVDFRRAPAMPYFVDEENILSPSKNGNLLEVPVTISRKKLNAGQYLRYLKQNKRIPYKGSRPLWLRPVFSSVDEFKKIIENVAQEQADENIIVYNMMFHNVEVMPGLNPYTKTNEDCERYLQSLEWLFKYCRDNNIQSVALSSLYELFRSEE